MSTGCHIVCHVECLNTVLQMSQLIYCQGCWVSSCTITSPVVWQEGMRVGKGNGYNHGCTVSALPSQSYTMHNFAYVFSKPDSLYTWYLLLCTVYNLYRYFAAVNENANIESVLCMYCVLYRRTSV